MIAIEDDYTLAWGRGLRGGGCFCERHLALFAKRFGRPLAAAEIAAAFENRTAANLPVRRAFHGQVMLAWRRERHAPDVDDFAAFLRPAGANADAV